ncbi:MAG: hypothetical protein ACYDH9_23955 [Limisphaerales bacterium]
MGFLLLPLREQYMDQVNNLGDRSRSPLRIVDKWIYLSRNLEAKFLAQQAGEIHAVGTVLSKVFDGICLLINVSDIPRPNGFMQSLNDGLSDVISICVHNYIW